MSGSLPAKIKRTEPWRQRLVRSLLYGRNVDRSAKARARVGFAIIAFAAIYAIIGGRLIMRIIHLLVIAVLVFAAAYVYRIKMDSTSRTERVLRLQGLAERHLPLKPISATQYDSLKNLPERPPNFVKPDDPDPIGAMIQTIDAAADTSSVTGSVPAPEDRQ